MLMSHHEQISGKESYCRQALQISLNDLQEERQAVKVRGPIYGEGSDWGNSINQTIPNHMLHIPLHNLANYSMYA